MIWRGVVVVATAALSVVIVVVMDVVAVSGTAIGAGVAWCAMASLSVVVASVLAAVCRMPWCDCVYGVNVDVAWL